MFGPRSFSHPAADFSERMHEETSRWERHQVLAMLTVLREIKVEEQLRACRVRKGELFARVSDLLKERNVRKTSKQIQEKYGVMKKLFIQVTSHNQQNRQERITMPYMEQLEMLLSQCPAVFQPDRTETETAVRAQTDQPDQEHPPLPQPDESEAEVFQPDRSEAETALLALTDQPDMDVHNESLLPEDVGRDHVGAARLAKRPSENSIGSQPLQKRLATSSVHKKECKEVYISNNQRCCKTFDTLTSLRAHLAGEHGISAAKRVVVDQFSSKKEFREWKAAYERDQGAQYVMTMIAATAKPVQEAEQMREHTFLFQCSKALACSANNCTEKGCLGHESSCSRAFGCTSEITATVLNDSSVTAVVYPFHYGHDVSDKAFTTLVQQADGQDKNNTRAELGTDSGGDRLREEQVVRPELEAFAQDIKPSIEVSDIAQQQVAVTVADVTVSTTNTNGVEYDSDPSSESDVSSDSDTLSNDPDCPVPPDEPPQWDAPSDSKGLIPDHLSARATAQLAQIIIDKLGALAQHAKTAQLPVQSKNVLLQLYSKVEQVEQTLAAIPFDCSLASTELTGTLSNNAGIQPPVAVKREPPDVQFSVPVMKDHTYAMMC